MSYLCPLSHLFNCASLIYVQAVPRFASAGVELIIQNGWLCSSRVETSIIIEDTGEIRVGPRTSEIMIECRRLVMTIGRHIEVPSRSKNQRLHEAYTVSCKMCITAKKRFQEYSTKAKIVL